VQALFADAAAGTLWGIGSVTVLQVRFVGEVACWLAG